MAAELGQMLLSAALLVALLQTAMPLWGAHRNRAAWMEVARPAAYAQFVLVAGAFAALTTAFVLQDFSVLYVAQNSNSLLPIAYRYSAVWGAHEGSLLLWVLVLALWGAAVAIGSATLPRSIRARVLGVMGLISAGFLSFLIFTSNPFTRLIPAAGEGRDLNPMLQDPGLIIHPPILYLGYVGFCVPFAFAVAVLLEGRIERPCLRWSRLWTNVAWGFLTVGIALGSWWAYYELGWGGWWFWDPVENASFMPWLVGTALIHSQAVTEKRGTFASWTLLLAIAAFALSLLGTFLVRSGILTSVHSFAADPARGAFILAFLTVIVGGALVLYVLRTATLAVHQISPGFTPASRDTALLANNLLLATACAMVLLGTLYPLLVDALGLGKVSVGPPYFGSLFILLIAPLVALLPLGPLLHWQRDQASRVIALLAPWALLAMLLGVIAFFVAPRGEVKTALAVCGATWVLLGTLRWLWGRLRQSGKITAEMWGMVMAHSGLAIFLSGALLVEALSIQREVAMSPGEELSVGAFTLRFAGVDQQQGPNFRADRAHVYLSRGNAQLALLHSEKRAYASGGQVMTEAGILPRLEGDIYVALGESLGNGAWAVRVHIKPFVRLIWLGALLMALGGFIAAADRRLRRP